MVIVTAVAAALAVVMASPTARMAASTIVLILYLPRMLTVLTAVLMAAPTLVPALYEGPSPIPANTVVPTTATLVGFWVHRGFRLVAGPVEETCLPVISVNEATPPVAVIMEGGRVRSPV